VLILPIDHQRGARRPLTARERWLVHGACVLAAALVIAVVIALATAGRSSSHGCVHAVFPGPVGAERVDSCGAAAKALCASVLASSQYGPEARRTIAGECRRAGLSVSR
jgi:hypothetical protein